MTDDNNQFTTLGTPSSEVGQLYDCENDSGTLENLSLINIFVGANNSGKSRLLRSLFEESEFSFNTLYFSASNYKGLINSAYEELSDFFVSRSQMGLTKENARVLFQDILNYGKALRTTENLRTMCSERIQVFSNTKESVRRPGPIVELFGHENLKLIVNTDQTGIENLAKGWMKSLTEILFDESFTKSPRVYVPIIRGMRPYGETIDSEKNADKDWYQLRTILDYFRHVKDDTNWKANHEIFSGLGLYIQLRNLLLGKPEGRKQIVKFQEYLSNTFFDGQLLTLIPRVGKDVVYVEMGSEDPYPIYEMGDGLQQLIILTFKIFTASERTLFFMEEPDLAMHPGMQRKFLEVLMDHPQHQYFVTTHSNHFLDMTLDYNNFSVYLFRKTPKNDDVRYSVNYTSTGDMNILQELGVKSSSVFRTNATIWVEGITDRLYLRIYLKKYMENNGRKKYQEDVHFSFVEYQGSNLVHWSFDDDDADTEKIKANYICQNSFLIADGDVSNKGTRENDYRLMLGDNFYLLKCKEIENLIPGELLLRYLRTKHKNFEDQLMKLKEADYYNSYEGMGKIIDDALEDGQNYATESGTVKNKINFCKGILRDAEENRNWKLTGQLEDLCSKVYGFIEEQNS